MKRIVGDRIVNILDGSDCVFEFIFESTLSWKCLKNHRFGEEDSPTDVPKIGGVESRRDTTVWCKIVNPGQCATKIFTDVES